MDKKTFVAAAIVLIILIFPEACLQIGIANAGAKTITVPDDYPNIQTAVRFAISGDTIVVKNGIYQVDDNTLIVIDKTLSLIGEDPEKTTINGSFSIHSSVSTPAIRVAAPNVTISGFTITNCETGIAVANYNSEPYPSGCKIVGNNIMNNFEGIRSQRNDLFIAENNITGNTEGGIMGSYTENIAISANNIAYNGDGISIKQCRNLTIEGNTIANNSLGLNLASFGFQSVYKNNITGNDVGIMFAEGCNNATVYENEITQNRIGVELLNFPYAAEGGFAVMGVGNMVYFNNFVNNSQQAFADTKLQFEFIQRSSNGTDIVLWDNGTMGNFWSSYNGIDANADGIGETPYAIDANNKDNYPFMFPFKIKNGTAVFPTPVSTPSLSTSSPIPNASPTATAPGPLSQNGNSATPIVVLGLILIAVVLIGLPYIKRRKKQQ